MPDIDKVAKLLNSLVPYLKIFSQWVDKQEKAAENIVPKPAYDKDPKTLPMNQDPYLWDTPANVRHSVRVICDEVLDLKKTAPVTFKDGTTRYFSAKDIITACIKQESEFNPKAVGRLNFNLTRDYGLCQYNNGRNKYGQAYWIGSGAPFASIEEVLNDPEKNVRVMVKQYKAGNIRLWASFSTGAYKQWL